MKKNTQNYIKITAALILIAFTVIADATIENILKDDKLSIAFAYQIDCAVNIDNTVELLFGTCENPERDNVNVYPPPSGPTGAGSYNSYFLEDRGEDEGILKAQILFYENDTDAEWLLELDDATTVTFTLKTDTAPSGSLILKPVHGTTETDIKNGITNKELDAGQYKIVYTHLQKSDTPKSITYTIKPGWNMLHFPLVVYEDAAEGAWEAFKALPKFSLIGKVFCKTEIINPGETFWVFNEGELKHFEIQAFQPLKSELPKSKDGWNFAGTSLTEEPYEAVYEWNGEKYNKIPESVSITDETKGYWINLTN